MGKVMTWHEDVKKVECRELEKMVAEGEKTV